MNTHHFNATAELRSLREQRRISRRRVYTQSRLSRYRAELVALRKAGASARELVSWLRHKKRVRVTHTTVLRYLAKMPELVGLLERNDVSMQLINIEGNKEHATIS